MIDRTADRNLTFGIEIETVGKSRPVVADAIATALNGTARWVGGTYDTVEVTMLDGRTWKVMRDGSLNCHLGGAEVVSPICRYEDIEMVQTVVRAVRACGAKVDASCGLHVHIGAKELGVAGVVNLAKMVAKNQDIIHHALGIAPRRLERWCKPVPTAFLARLDAAKPTTFEELNVCWYGRSNPNPHHYDDSRYHGLNLHNVWFRKTVEFRWFESTLHAGEVKAYLQLCYALAMAARAKRCTSAAARTFNAETAKYDWRVVLLRLNLIGEEFATARLHLQKRLEGQSRTKRRAAATTTAEVAA